MDKYVRISADECMHVACEGVHVDECVHIASVIKFSDFLKSLRMRLVGGVV